VAGTAIEIWRCNTSSRLLGGSFLETLVLVDMVSEVLCRGILVMGARCTHCSPGQLQRH
jgi:hypothetical protein